MAFGELAPDGVDPFVCHDGIPVRSVDHGPEGVQRKPVDVDGLLARGVQDGLGFADPPGEDERVGGVVADQEDLKVVDAVLGGNGKAGGAGRGDVVGAHAAGQQHVCGVDGTPDVTERVLPDARS